MKTAKKKFFSLDIGSLKMGNDDDVFLSARELDSDRSFWTSAESEQDKAWERFFDGDDELFDMLTLRLASFFRVLINLLPAIARDVCCSMSRARFFIAFQLVLIVWLNFIFVGFESLLCDCVEV